MQMGFCFYITIIRQLDEQNNSSLSDAIIVSRVIHECLFVNYENELIDIEEHVSRSSLPRMPKETHEYF